MASTHLPPIKSIVKSKKPAPRSPPLAAPPAEIAMKCCGRDVKCTLFSPERPECCRDFSAHADEWCDACDKYRAGVEHECVMCNASRPFCSDVENDDEFWCCKCGGDEWCDGCAEHWYGTGTDDDEGQEEEEE
jgi:hypothetical protein